MRISQEEGKKYVLVIQLPEHILTYDKLIELEDALIEQLNESEDVDGHDMGSGEINIFVMTDEPNETFVKIKRLLNEEMTEELRAAYRAAAGEEYNILWPSTLKEFRVS